MVSQCLQILCMIQVVNIINHATRDQCKHKQKKQTNKQEMDVTLFPEPMRLWQNKRSARVKKQTLRDKHIFSDSAWCHDTQLLQQIDSDFLIDNAEPLCYRSPLQQLDADFLIDNTESLQQVDAHFPDIVHTKDVFEHPTGFRNKVAQKRLSASQVPCTKERSFDSTKSERSSTVDNEVRIENKQRSEAISHERRNIITTVNIH